MIKKTTATKALIYKRRDYFEKISCFATGYLFYCFTMWLRQEKKPAQENMKSNPSTDFEYSENVEGSITITKYIGNAADVIIPAKICGKNITEIGSSAFSCNQKIVTITMPDTVKTIGNGAFQQCPVLEKITLSQGLISIGNSAFSDCNKLGKITLPECLTKIGISAFLNCTSLKHITIPKSVTELGWGSFSSSGLETLTIEDGLEIIPDDAFANTQLREVVLPSSITELGSQAFGGCPNLISVVLNKNLVKIGDRAFGGKSKLTEIIIPESVQNITEHAFSGCNTLEKVKFEGNAPDDYVYPVEEMPIKPVDVHYTVYYREGKSGWTFPEWNGYATEKW